MVSDVVALVLFASVLGLYGERLSSGHLYDIEGLAPDVDVPDEDLTFQPLAEPQPLDPLPDAPVSDLEPAHPVDPDLSHAPMAETPANEAFHNINGEDGEVDFIYTFGSPGGASPALYNQRGPSTCFNGVRSYLIDQGKYWGRWTDIVSQVSNTIFYSHSQLRVLAIENEQPEWKPSACTPDAVWEPRGIQWGSAQLHRQKHYIANAKILAEAPSNSTRKWIYIFSVFAADAAYKHEPLRVSEMVKEHGWRLAGSAIHPGGWVYGGRQTGHLMQHPETLECVLTFQGTDSLQGWISNFDWMSTSFCGLSDRDESCRFRMWGCKTRHPRGAFVHAGFAGRLRAMTRSQVWQHNIHRFLPSCAAVHAVGHSLGGVVAELFSTCVSKAPQPGQFGYTDYRWMGWKKGTPSRLPWL